MWVSRPGPRWQSRAGSQAGTSVNTAGPDRTSQSRGHGALMMMMIMVMMMMMMMMMMDGPARREAFLLMPKEGPDQAHAPSLALCGEMVASF
jgi:hypothetical protein